VKLVIGLSVVVMIAVVEIAEEIAVDAEEIVVEIVEAAVVSAGKGEVK
jgi:hypothetical protein